MAVTEQTFRQVALEDPSGLWELHCGKLRQKPGMTAPHNNISDNFVYQLHHQLDREQFRVRQNGGHVRTSDGRYYIPDISIIPIALLRPQLSVHDDLEVYQEPLPLVVEIWSRSTGSYDINEKIPEYQRRGDLEIWRIHPVERMVTIWRRQSDGGYEEVIRSGGTVHLHALLNVSIDLDTLFD
jgi:Uma2 family endonuclease